MRRSHVARHAIILVVAALVTAGVTTVSYGKSAGAATPQGTVAGEGGDALGPIMAKLVDDDSAGLAPDSGSFTNVDLDQGIADFVGTAPGTFGNDFAVTERKLTSAETAEAAMNGRSYAYVPFAATPVALMTLVPNSTYAGSLSINSAQFCQHIPLTLDQLDGIYGVASPQYSGWGDSRLSCTASPTTPADSLDFFRWANLDPTEENFALMSLLDSTQASEASFGAALAAAKGQAATTDPSASEHWPYSGTALAGGDKATLGKLIGLDPRTGAPSTVASQVSLGAIMPVASDWTGDPLGVTWNLPTAAVQNAAQAFVAPSAAAAQAAENDATLAATSDPTTNNLVTFNANASDAAAYNKWLMMESYLLVPTNGLPADKALALAQFIRFVVGGTGQADITALGAAPATKAMVTADLAVAQELDAEAGSAPAANTSSTTTTTTPSTSTTTTTTTTVASAAAAGTGNSGTGSSSPGTDGSTAGGLAVTGSNPLPLLGLGVVFLVCGELALRFVRRRKARA
jgi:hypothetical protein